MIAVGVWAVSWLFGLWSILFRMTFGKYAERDATLKANTLETYAIFLVSYFSGVFFARVTLALLRDFGVVA